MPDNDNTPPKNKELADKKLSEITTPPEPTAPNQPIPTSSTSASTASPVSPTTDNSTAPNQNSTIAPQTPEVPSKKGGWFKWKIFKKKAQVETTPTKDQKLNEVTVMTNAGEVGQVTTEALLKIVDEKIQQVSGEELIVIKIKKSLLLTLGGIILVALWLMPLFKWGSSKVFDEVKGKFDATFNQTTSTTASKIKIRIRTNAASDLQTKVVSLINGAVDAEVEVIPETVTPATQSAIVTKTTNIELQQKLINAIISTVNLSTNSAVLTGDSQVDATIFIGSQSARP